MNTFSNNALAVHVAGDTDSFVQKMNDFAKKIGMNHTRFVDAWGGSKMNYTCVSDMIKLLKYAYKKKLSWVL